MFFVGEDKEKRGFLVQTMGENADMCIKMERVVEREEFLPQKAAAKSIADGEILVWRRMNLGRGAASGGRALD